MKSPATVSSGVANGPILLAVDNFTPDCLYLILPGTEPL